MNVSGRALGLAMMSLAGIALAGCHADITERVAYNANGSATVTVVETMDDQFASMAASQGGSDPFGVETARKGGWGAARSVDNAGNHVVTLVKTVSGDEVKDAISRTPLGSHVPSGDQPSLVKQTGLFQDTYSLQARIPALMPPVKASSSNPYAGMASTMAASIVSVHFVLSAPGKLMLSTGLTSSWRS